MVKRKHIALSVIILVSIGIFIGLLLTLKTPFTVTQGEEAMDYKGFLTELQMTGVTVEDVGEVSLPFFSGRGQAIVINGEHVVMVFEYGSTASADAEAGLVSHDGRTIGEHRPTYTFTPHYYKKGRIIVLYVGENIEVMQVLEAILGPQFAGNNTLENGNMVFRQEMSVRVRARVLRG